MSEPSVKNNNTSPTATVVIHESYTQPVATAFDGKDEIKFHHPGYSPPHDILFILPRLDRSPTSVQGVHYGTALTACQIIAGNAFDGHLATDRGGHGRVDSRLGFDHLLTKSDYWFFVPSTPSNPNPYPIVPSFQDWAFPHQRRLRWPQPRSVNSGIIEHRCIVTRTAGFITEAHLIPASEKKWFEINAMSQYGSHGDIDQRHNKIALRHDLHFAFDTHLFAIVPKNNNYVVHQFHATETSTIEFALAHHNYKVVRQPRDVVPEFLFARFARAVLMLVKPFIAQAPINRYVSRFRVVNDKNDGSSEYNIKSEWLSPEQLADQYSGKSTKNATPSKRKRNDEGNSNNSDGSDTEGKWYEKNVAVALEGDRGRSQKRRCDDSRHNKSHPPSL